jgi:hypothetical protein
MGSGNYCKPYKHLQSLISPGDLTGEGVGIANQLFKLQ